MVNCIYAAILFGILIAGIIFYLRGSYKLMKYADFDKEALVNRFEKAMEYPSLYKKASFGQLELEYLCSYYQERVSDDYWKSICGDKFIEDDSVKAEKIRCQKMATEAQNRLKNL